MAAERVVIVGAGPAGLSTARAYREAGGAGAVTIVGEEPHLPYERPPLSKEFLRGELDAAELPIEPGEWYEQHDVRLRLGERVAAIDPAAGLVAIDGREPEHADAIVLATGAEPSRGPIEGAEDPRVGTFRTVADGRRERAGGGSAAGPVVVIGTGFIGCEVAASLAIRGERVVIVGEDELPQRARLGERVAARVAAWLEELGVELLGGAGVSAIRDGSTVELEGGRAIDAARVVLGLGVRPRVELAREAGLAVCDGAVPVDAAMRCEDEPRVLAAGDVALALNAAAGRRLRVEHWGDALGHGDVAGRVLAGEDAAWDGVPGFWSSIGEHTLKYAAWGDGHDEVRFVEGEDGAFTAWYGREGVTVGVLSHERDEDYESGREMVREGAALP